MQRARDVQAPDTVKVLSGVRGGEVRDCNFEGDVAERMEEVGVDKGGAREGEEMGGRVLEGEGLVGVGF